MNRVKIDKKALNAKMELAFRQTCFALGRQFTLVISDPGAFPEFPGQDIVDLGVFRASQRLDFPRAGVGRFTWNVEYAIYLLKGWETKSGTKVPGRDWIKEGQNRAKTKEVFRKFLEQELKT